MRVSLYVPDKLYGFCEGDVGTRVFFHLSAFPIAAGDPPPVLGEAVAVELAPSGSAARTVRRMDVPRRVSGVVKSFSAKDGWGFIAGDDRTDYFAHRSDVVGGHILVQGQAVRFVAGHKNGRPRACYVTG
jgi:cold shock CspA family protein